MHIVQQLIERIGKERRRIVIIGDAFVDLYVHGRFEECQDSCPKFIEHGRFAVPGGAANAERSISNWKVTTSLYARNEGDRPTKTRLMDSVHESGSRVVVRWDDDARYNRDCKQYGWCWRDALEMVGCAGGVLFSDYDKGFLPVPFIQEVAKRCIERNIPCVADAKHEPETYAGCILKGNSDYSHQHNDKMWNWTEAGFSLVITEGPIVPAVWDCGTLQKGFKFQPNVRLVNHVGAGDCFAAHLTLALAYGFSLKDAAVLAHSAGRVYVQHAHNRPPTVCEIAEDLGL